MERVVRLWDRVAVFLDSGIAGSEFTPLRLLTVITLITVLVWVTRRVTRWFIAHVLVHRGFDIGLREALGAIVRYVVISLGALVILQSAGIDLTSLNVLVGAVGVGLGFGLQNITSNFFSGLILSVRTADQDRRPRRARRLRRRSARDRGPRRRRS